MDLGESINMVGSLMKEMNDSEEGEESSESFNIYDKPEKMDTIMDFATIMPDSIKEKLTDPEALSIMQMHLKVDSEQEIGMMKMVIDYSSKEELENFYTALKEMDPKDENANPNNMMQLGDTKEKMEQMFEQHSVDMANQVIRIERADPLKELKEDEGFLVEMQPMIDSLQYLPEDSFERQMIESLIPGELKTVVHAPGNILFTSDPSAIIDGNTVTFTQNVLNALKEGKEVPTGDIIIKFKK